MAEIQKLTGQEYTGRYAPRKQAAGDSAATAESPEE
jgi:hypothetical protein